MSRERTLIRSFFGALAAALLLAASASAQQADGAGARDDAAYTAKIREYTTEKYFSTEFVDHLPASSTVPSPDKILGHIVGAPNHLTYTKDIYRYLRELERASPRVRVFVAPERSEEGREQLLVAVSDEANLQRLRRHKEITARLADPRQTFDAEAERLI